jgi:hypothetical protein
MKCLHCGSGIGIIRRIRDRQYCCDEHRRRARAVLSARVLRDDEASGFFEAWMPESTGGKRRRSQFNPGAGIALAALGAMAMIALPGGGSGGGQRAHSIPSFTGSAPSWAPLRGGRPGLELREDFRRDLRDWQQRAESAIDL